MLKLKNFSLVCQAPAFIILIYIINLPPTLASQSIYSLPISILLPYLSALNAPRWYSLKTYIIRMSLSSHCITTSQSLSA